MLTINYQKRKNNELFRSLEIPNNLFISNLQNYIPIYNKFFELNETNFNSINLNHKFYICNINKSNETDYHLYNCRVKNIVNNKAKDKNLYFKLAPLLDPYKYLIGKYNIMDDELFRLPELNSSQENCNKKILDPNNSAYVDGFFLYLTNELLNMHSFSHGIEYYGSFLGVKNDFIINVFEDIHYLNNSEFFNKNKNILFKIDDYEHLFQEDKEQLKPISIHHNTTANSQLSVHSFDIDIFEEIFEDNICDLNDIKCNKTELVEITKSNLMIDIEQKNQFTLKSTSTCSSRSSYTDIGDIEKDNQYNDDEVINETEGSESQESSDDEFTEEEEIINVTIPKFPVQVICMEHCENTFDDLILTEDLTNDEWYSAFMQIIMTLITYQKSFHFTHNDLHTNNVMYNKTDKKFIYYCYKNKYYKVPTFGRIFKIIDFGRAIYKFNGKNFCSDSFQTGGDAATQYNTEPYFNENKPRLEPNYSFDLCRLACSIFDYVIDDFEEIKDISNCKDSVKRLIVEWCLDDNGINMLYKNTGVDRYPDFKLYKMISRCVHNHTPQSQLERPEFDKYSKFKGDIPNDVINIDNIPIYV